MHRPQDVTSADKLLVHVQLGDSRPVRILLDTLAKLRVLEDVKGSKLFRVDALHAEDLDDCGGEAALGHLGSSLHEQHNRRRSDGLVNGRAGCVGQETDLEGRQRRDGSSEGDGRSDSWARSLPQEILDA